MRDKIVVFTNNAHKISEISEILSECGLDIVPYSTLFDVIDVVEDGQTFTENAIKKVAHFKDDQYLYLAEDSGLVVPALNGEPGVKSARYAGKGATAKDLCEKVLNKMKNIKSREAAFHAVMAVRFPGGDILTRSGTVQGKISTDMRGAGGFGYDPIFIPDGYDQTFAELPQSLKNRLSHRKQALVKVKALLEKFEIVS